MWAVLTCLADENVAPVVISTAVAGGAAAFAGCAWLFHLRSKNRRLATAINNMSEGLCLLSPTGDLILCNEPYLRMYGLSASRVKPGCSLRQLLEERIAANTFGGNIHTYMDNTLREIAA